MTKETIALSALNGASNALFSALAAAADLIDDITAGAKTDEQRAAMASLYVAGALARQFHSAPNTGVIRLFDDRLAVLFTCEGARAGCKALLLEEGDGYNELDAESGFYFTPVMPDHAVLSALGKKYPLLNIAE